jgi:hypothetical protein
LAEPPETVSPTAIDAAPDEDVQSVAVATTAVSTDVLLDAFNRLQTENEALIAEVNRLTGSTENERAKLVRPYAWAVFWFLCVYCGIVGLLIFLDGLHPGGFHIPDVVLTTAVGSTAASAIWLVRIIVQGLFPDTSTAGRQA